MHHRRSSRWLLTGLLALIGCASGATGARAQSFSEPMVKAGFLYNFIKFAQWPQLRDGDRSPVVICTPGLQPLDGQYQALHGRSVGARTIEVRAQVPAGDWRQCQMVYFTEADTGRLVTSLRSLGDTPVLTVGDTPDFVKSGGMIGLRLDDNRVRFDVNLGAAQRAGITLSSQMTKLAGQVLR